MTASQTALPHPAAPVTAVWEDDATPRWEPLMHHVGPLLIRWFQYMGRSRMRDGTAVHAYKHVLTRRYLHLADDLRCFNYDGAERYVELPRRRATIAVFADESRYPADEDEFAVYRAAVGVALHLARLRDEDPIGERAVCLTASGR